MFNQKSRGGTYPGMESLKGWNLSRNEISQGVEPIQEWNLSRD